MKMSHCCEHFVKKQTKTMNSVSVQCVPQFRHNLQFLLNKWNDFANCCLPFEMNSFVDLKTCLLQLDSLLANNQLLFDFVGQPVANSVNEQSMLVSSATTMGYVGRNKDATKFGDFVIPLNCAIAAILA